MLGPYPRIAQPSPIRVEESNYPERIAMRTNITMEFLNQNKPIKFSYIFPCRLSIVFGVKLECIKYGYECRIPQCCQKRFGKLKFFRKLLQQLPCTIQKQQQQWTLSGRITVDYMPQTITIQNRFYFRNATPYRISYFSLKLPERMSQSYPLFLYKRLKATNCPEIGIQQNLRQAGYDTAHVTAIVLLKNHGFGVSHSSCGFVRVVKA